MSPASGSVVLRIESAEPLSIFSLKVDAGINKLSGLLLKMTNWSPEIIFSKPLASTFSKDTSSGIVNTSNPSPPSRVN